MVEVLKVERLTPTEFCVLYLLGRLRRARVSDLAAEAMQRFGISAWTVRRCVRSLFEKGLVKYERDGRSWLVSLREDGLEILKGEE